MLTLASCLGAPNVSSPSKYSSFYSANSLGSQDNICGQKTNGHEYPPSCFYYFSILPIPGVMFTCDDPATNPQPTSTTSVAATAVAGVATSPASGPQMTAASVTSTSSIGMTPSPTTASTGSEGTSGGPSGTASSTHSSGLDISDKIAIGVGLGVGIPSIIIALAAWLRPRTGAALK